MSDKIYISELPNLMREWDWDKNSADGLFPEQLYPKSNKKAHWVQVAIKRLVGYVHSVEIAGKQVFKQEFNEIVAVRSAHE